MAPLLPDQRRRRCLGRREPPRVEAEAPGPEGRHDQHAAGDGQVLHEVDLLHQLLGLRRGPEVVKDDRSEQREAGERDDGLARVEAGHQRQPTAELDDDRQRREELRQRQALARDVAGRAVESRDLGEAGEDEDEAEEDAAEKYGGALQRCHGALELWRVETGDAQDARSKTSTSACRPLPSARRLSPVSAAASPPSRCMPLTSTLPRTTWT